MKMQMQMKMEMEVEIRILSYTRAYLTLLCSAIFDLHHETGERGKMKEVF